MTTYDGIIIGAGHNGLITQAYLARAGLKVVSLDALPATLAKVDPDVRRLLTAKRAADYDLRWTEN